MSEIESHQDLLNRYYKAERIVMYETSGSIMEHCQNLIEQVDKYASLHQLESPVTQDDRDDIAAYNEV